MAGAVSIRDVARAAGVSVSTVSNVLNHPENVSPETRATVQRAIDRLGFVRNESARQLRSGSSHAIGVILIDAANPFFMTMARGAEDLVRERGEVVILGDSDGDAERERRYVALFERLRVRGVLMTPTEEKPPDLTGLTRLGIPVVFLDRPTDDSPHSSVSVDNVAGGRIAGEYLRDLGHRRVCYVGGPMEYRQPRQRLDGFRSGFDGLPISFRHEETSALSMAEGRRAGARLAGLDVAQRPTAVFAANDLIAIGVLNSLITQGIRVPQEVSLVGFDDIDYARSTTVPLTTISQPAMKIGRASGGLLYDEIDAASGSTNGESRARGGALVASGAAVGSGAGVRSGFGSGSGVGSGSGAEVRSAVGAVAVEPHRVAFERHRIAFEPHLVVRESTAPPPDRV